MNDTVLVITAAAVLALASYALASRYNAVWGVDDSRSTPALEGGRSCGSVRLLADLIGCMAAPAWLAGARAGGMYAALGLCGALALAGGTAAYASAFVCLRCGGVRLSKAAREELGAAAGRVLELLAFLSCMALGALLAREGTAALGFAWAQPAQGSICAALLSAAAGLNVILCSGYGARIRREDEAAPLCMGGTGIAALLCALLAVAGHTGAVSLLAPYRSALHAAFALLCAVAALRCALEAARALKALFARESVLRKTRKAPFALYMALSLGGIAALAFAGVPWLAEIAGALGGAYALSALALCALWLRRVGRGLLL